MTSTRKRERQPPGNRVSRAELRDLTAPPRDDGDRVVEAVEAGEPPPDRPTA